MKWHAGAKQREYWFEEGCWITEWANHADDEAMSIVRARVPSLGVTRWHALDGTTERYVVLDGSGRAEIGDRRIDVTAGDVLVIEPGEAQRIVNTGQEELVFLAICTPRFRPEAYRDLEPDSNVDDKS